MYDKVNTQRNVGSRHIRTAEQIVDRAVEKKMVDESMRSMSQEIAGGQVADAVLTIQSLEGKELPSMEENFEMLLHVFSWDDMDFEEDHEVKVEF